MFKLYAIKYCQVLVRNLNFVAGMTRRFVSAKRLIRYFSNSSKLVEHRAQSPVREVKMLAVWPSIAEGLSCLNYVLVGCPCTLVSGSMGFLVASLFFMSLMLFKLDSYDFDDS